MSALSFVTLLAAAAVCCGASLVKRQAPESIDICQVSSLDIYDGADFDLTSPNFGFGNYLDNTNCATVLQSGKEALIVTVTFESVDLERNSECRYDSLCLNGVNFCGSWAAKKSFRVLVPGLNSVTLGFKTDISVTALGLSVRIVARAATSEDEIFQVDSGVGSSADRINYRQVSNSQEYLSTYTDRCTVYQSQPYSSNYTSSNVNWGYYTSPSNGSGYTSYNYTGSWNNYNSSSSNDSGGNYTTRPYTTDRNNYTSSSNVNWSTSPSYTGARNNYTSPSYTGGRNNYTSPSYTGGRNNYTSPSYTGGRNNYTSPSYTGGRNNYTSPSYTGGRNYTSPSSNGNWTFSSTNSRNWTTPSSNNGNWTTPSSNNGNWTFSSTNSRNLTTSSSNNGTWLTTSATPSRSSQNSTGRPVTTRRPAARSG